MRCIATCISAVIRLSWLICWGLPVDYAGRRPLPRKDEMAEQDDYTAKMQRLKASVDRRIEAAQDEKGLLIVYTGAGKGKTTAALGMALRCLGHGMKVAIVQFIKGAIDTAEERILKSFGDRVTFLRMGEGYTWETQDRERDTSHAQAAWAKACEFMRDPSVRSSGRRPTSTGCSSARSMGVGGVMTCPSVNRRAPPVSMAGNRLIWGEPMKLATKTLAGRE